MDNIDTEAVSAEAAATDAATTAAVHTAVPAGTADSVAQGMAAANGDVKLEANQPTDEATHGTANVHTGHDAAQTAAGNTDVDKAASDGVTADAEMADAEATPAAQAGAAEQKQQQPSDPSTGKHPRLL